MLLKRICIVFIVSLAVSESTCNDWLMGVLSTHAQCGCVGSVGVGMSLCCVIDLITMCIVFIFSLWWF